MNEAPAPFSRDLHYEVGQSLTASQMQMRLILLWLHFNHYSAHATSHSENEWGWDLLMESGMARETLLPMAALTSGWATLPMSRLLDTD